MPAPAWQRALAAVAFLKIGVGITAVLAAVLLPSIVVAARTGLILATVVVFAAAGAWLIPGGRRDRRARTLGVLFVLTASVFADSLLVPFRGQESPLLTTVRGLFAIQVDAFSPLLLWLFVREFPRASQFGTVPRIERFAIALAMATGSALLAANIAAFGASVAGASIVQDALAPMTRRADITIYWVTQYLISLPAFGVLLWKARGAPLDERRRVRLLIAGIVIGSVPTLARAVVIAIWPSTARLLPLATVGWIVYPTLLSTPLTTAYAVLVHHALDVRLVVRRALQYAMARQSVLGLTSLPFIVLLVLVYARRDRSVTQIAASPDGVALVVLVLLGLTALRGRRRLLDRLDRRFFREQYDSREILRELVEQCARVPSREELGQILRAGIDRALHLEVVSVLFLERREGVFASPRGDVRPLDVTSALVESLERSDGAIDVSLEDANSAGASLPERDQAWIADAGVRLILPLRDGERRLSGIVVLGDKKSELPFSTEDRHLLSVVASAASLSLNYLTSYPPRQDDVEPTVAPVGEELAAECVDCGTLHAAGETKCSRCGAPTMESNVPLMLAGKFRLLQRAGAGAMGVVYCGLDLQLDRPVAIKTLPRIHPDAAVRMRREARTMASVSHPNLALIYAGETWYGRPMLVCEFLAGGTLRDRLLQRAMSPTEVLELGVTLTSALAAIHKAGILHRDVKPSNVGFTRDGVPKLLDFGIARLLAPAEEPTAPVHRTHDTLEVLISEAVSDGETAPTATPAGQIVGTPLYLSPEAARGEPAHPSFDLWSTCMVLFEAIAGRHPLTGNRVPGALQRIRDADIPALTDLKPDAPSDLVAFFSSELSASSSRRAHTAEALRDRIRALLDARSPRT